MAIIDATVTEQACELWAKFFAQLTGISAGATVPNVAWNPLINKFKVGEGGWINAAGGPIPRNPESNLVRLDNGLADIDAAVDGTRLPANRRYPTDSRATFTKSLLLADFTFEAPSTLKARCTLSLGDFNDDGFGNPPEIWEIGLYSDSYTVGGQPVCVAYGTFDKQIKTPGVQLENYVRITFGRKV